MVVTLVLGLPGLGLRSAITTHVFVRGRTRGKGGRWGKGRVPDDLAALGTPRSLAFYFVVVGGGGWEGHSVVHGGQ